MVMLDIDGRIDIWNRAAERMFGWTQAELRGSPAPYHRSAETDHDEPLRRRLLSGEVISGIETALRRKDGSLIDVEMSAALVHDDASRPAGYLTIISDNSERKRAESSLRFVASHDPLTGLLNRAMFGERLQQALAQAQRHERKVAVLFVDLDGFKLVNDNHGHDAGDVFLAEIAHRLRECMREGDTLGRLGGDEFVVLIEGYREDTHVVDVARKILDTVARPLALGEGSYTVTASVGIATCPEDGRHAPELLKSADLAMYRAKNEGRNTFRFHSAEMDTHLVERVGMKRALRVALERQEITVFYQPRVSLEADRMLGIEALVRWRHPTQGLLTPSQFLPIAEDNGTYELIGNWIFAAACRQLRDWQRCGVGDLRVALNISACELAQDDFLERLRASISKSGIEPACLELEITEATLMRHAERAGRVLSGVKELGAHIVLDDFGTGYSSLSCLKRFPIDAVKIDRSLVAQLPDGADAAGIARAVISMAGSLGLEVTAEGVETRAQRDFLALHGCHAMQGHYFCAPAPPEGLAAILLQHIAGNVHPIRAMRARPQPRPAGS
jgi:diguanylate cyclase (GGDEF)-like protein/PAS domain S-box-containing protein